MRGLLRAVIGLGVPIVLVLGLVQAIGWRPAPAPEPAAIAEATPTGDAVEMVGSPSGTWVLADEGSYVGYRVVEHYPQLGKPSEGVGRTEDVEGSLRIEDQRLTRVEVRADLRGLESGHANRDRAVQVRYLKAEDHPWASFRLEAPLPLVPFPAPGDRFEIDGHGILEVRGIERPVRFPLEGRWDGDQVVVAGQLPVALSDWEIERPDIPGFVRVDDEAVIEVHLRYVRPDEGP